MSSSHTPATDPPVSNTQVTGAEQQPVKIIVCYSRCWACMCGQCYEPPREHPWWDTEDVEHAEATNQPAPQGTCACPCAHPEEQQ